jgi:hypothetical protein
MSENLIRCVRCGRESPPLKPLDRPLDARGSLTMFNVDGVQWCEYVDFTDTDILDVEPACPMCGGTEFEGVHRNDLGSGSTSESFTRTLEPLDDE